MFAKSLIASAITLASLGTAFAQEATPEPKRIESTVTRAEVHAQAVAARQAGTVDGGEATTVAPVLNTSNVNRAQVAAEASEAVRLNAVQFGEVHRVISDEQIELIRKAGQRAVEASRVVAAR